MISHPSRCDAGVAAEILDAARAAGACAAGFATVQPLPDADLDIYRSWIAAGRHGGMDYLARYDDVRANPALLIDGAQSMLCVAFAYRDSSSPRHPLLADYALGEDYHTVLRRRLEPVAEAMRKATPGSDTRICIDTAPLRERLWAVRAGLGFIGLNNCLIIPGIGSRVFLAEILWTAAAPPSEPCSRSSCDGCGACVRACPGAALDGCGGLDARRCLSYLTIEHRGALPPWLSLAGRRIYGCDVCQDVCPHNRGTADAPVAEEFRPRQAVMSLDRERIATMTQEEFSTIFRGSAVKRAKLSGLLRNAAHTSGSYKD